MGEYGTAGGFTVDGVNGENAILAHGRTQAEAWRLAAEQARTLGLLGRARPPWRDAEPFDSR